MTGAAMTTNGTPDRYLDFRRDLWAEFKFHPALPIQLHMEKILSPLQSRWLNRRHAAGGNAVVVAGFIMDGKNVGVILNSPSLWNGAPLPRAWLVANAQTIPQLAKSLLLRIS